MISNFAVRGQCDMASIDARAPRIATLARQASANVVSIDIEEAPSSAKAARRRSTARSSSSGGRRLQLRHAPKMPFRRSSIRVPEHDYRSGLTVGDTAIAAHLSSQQSKTRAGGAAKDSLQSSRGPFGGSVKVAVLAAPQLATTGSSDCI